jgi:hypothetical protein
MKNFRRFRFHLVAVTATALLAPFHAVPQEQTQASPPIHVMRAMPVGSSTSPATETPVVPFVNNGHGITYHGGPILPFINVYLIWYGNWAGDTATTILPDMVSNLGGSSYFSINTTYDDSSGASVLNAVFFAGSITDNYSQGTSLTDASVAAIVTNAMNANGGVTLNRMYIVLTSPDVMETQNGYPNYCGWHSYLSDGITMYAWVGNPTLHGQACMAQTASSPNGNVGADAMANTMVHEIDETVTDPNINAWNNGSTAEVGDLCNFNFGSTFFVSNGSTANMTLGARNYLIQQEWVNSGGGFCGKQLASGAVPNAPAAISPLGAATVQISSLPYTVFWSASTGAAPAWYNVCLSDDGFQSTRGCQGSTSGNAGAGISTILFSDPSTVRVQGCNVAGCGGWSPPSAPILYCTGEC